MAAANTVTRSSKDASTYNNFGVLFIDTDGTGNRLAFVHGVANASGVVIDPLGANGYVNISSGNVTVNGAVSIVSGNVSVNGAVTVANGSITVNGAVSISGGTVNTNAFSVGTTGLDFSGNKPAIPNIGAAFAANSLYSSYVLVTTRVANPLRNLIDVENASGGQIVIVRDDGTAAAGAAANNASVFPLSGGSAVGSQGGSWTSSTFKGRIQVYAASNTAFVPVFED